MRIFITGITGTLGSRLSRLFLDNDHDVVGYSRDELKQADFYQHPRLTLYLGDVRDRTRLLEASRNADIVYHLAAMKRIEMADSQPEEVIATNILGTENVLFAQRMNKIARVILVSTDKAVEPINAYGASKLLAETLTLRNPNNIVARYGNVLGSRGSVLQAWEKTLSNGGFINITHRQCTRFWWLANDAAQFVYLLHSRPTGGLAIPNLKAFPVLKLGLMLSEIRNRSKPHIIETGFRAREKLHEVMRTKDEGGRMESSDPTLWLTPQEMKDTLKTALEDLWM